MDHKQCASEHSPPRVLCPRFATDRSFQPLELGHRVGMLGSFSVGASTIGVSDSQEAYHARNEDGIAFSTNRYAVGGYRYDVEGMKP